MTEPIITDEYLAKLNPPDLTKLPQPGAETVIVPARFFAEVLCIAREVDDLDDRQDKLMKTAHHVLGSQAPTTYEWFTAREAALDAWVKTL